MVGLTEERKSDERPLEHLQCRLGVRSRSAFPRSSGNRFRRDRTAVRWRDHIRASSAASRPGEPSALRSRRLATASGQGAAAEHASTHALRRIDRLGFALSATLVPVGDLGESQRQPIGSTARRHSASIGRRTPPAFSRSSSRTGPHQHRSPGIDGGERIALAGQHLDRRPSGIRQVAAHYADLSAPRFSLPRGGFDFVLPSRRRLEQLVQPVDGPAVRRIVREIPAFRESGRHGDDRDARCTSPVGELATARAKSSPGWSWSGQIVSERLLTGVQSVFAGDLAPWIGVVTT